MFTWQNEAGELKSLSLAVALAGVLKWFSVFEQRERASSKTGISAPLTKLID